MAFFYFLLVSLYCEKGSLYQIMNLVQFYMMFFYIHYKDIKEITKAFILWILSKELYLISIDEVIKVCTLMII